MITYSAWKEWFAKKEIAGSPPQEKTSRGCAPEVRMVFEEWAHRQIAKALCEFPPEVCAPLREYLEDTADARRRCAELFDSRAATPREKTGRSDKDRMREMRPQRDGEPTQEDYARAWTCYANRIMATEVARRLIREATDVTEVDLKCGYKGKEALIGENDDERPFRARSLSPSEEVELREVAVYGRGVELSDRERLVLWADANDIPCTDPGLKDLAGCEKSQISACLKTLGRRLKKGIYEHFALDDEGRAERWACWVIENLMLDHRNLRPEKLADGSLKWGECKTK